MNYVKLTIKSIRKTGDEVKSRRAVIPAYDHINFEGHPKDLIPDWRPTNLIGQRILGADLLHFEFRRPV